MTYSYAQNTAEYSSVACNDYGDMATLCRIVISQRPLSLFYLELPPSYLMWEEEESINV